MPTTFDVFYLGTGPIIDPTEGNAISENASALVGTTFGGVGDPLVDYIQSFSPSGAGFAGGTADVYDSNNNLSNDQFSINGGPTQTFDAITSYFATITYIDGTTATITAVVFQDTAGNLYLAPEISDVEGDETKLEAKPIRSLTLDSIETNNSNMGANRLASNYAVCFTESAAILTPQGERLIGDLKVGDLVVTMDNGSQPIRWIGRKHLGQRALLAKPELRPVLIRRDVIGARRDVLVSPQHGILIGRDHLVRAKHLAEAPRSRVRVACGRKSVTYVHLMFDAHQIIFADGVASESFFPGPQAQRMLDFAAFAEVKALFPDVVTPNADLAQVLEGYGGTARGFLRRRSVQAHVDAGCLVSG